MDNFNKVISFILGLVVVIIFFAVITGRLNIRQKIPFLTAKTSPTPSPTEKITPTPTPISSVRIKTDSAYNRYQTTQGKTPGAIPATGSPTIFLPLFLSGLIGGYFLRKQ